MERLHASINFSIYTVLLTAPVLQAVDGSEQDERVSRVIAQLGASQYADREDASKQLVAMGGIVVDPLIGAAQEMTRRLPHEQLMLLEKCFGMMILSSQAKRNQLSN